MAERVSQFDSATAKRIEVPDTSAIEKELEKNIKGQPEAVEFWARTLNRVLNDTPRLRNGPLAVVTEIGPSGVGKTEIVKEVARYLASKSEDARSSMMADENGEVVPPVLRIDCAEFQRAFDVTKVLGAPPGYAGYQDTPRLAQSEIDRYAISLDEDRQVTFLLLDEIEKANKAFNKVFLGGMDYGMITLGNGDKTNIKNCIVVFTSNLGNREMQAAESSGPNLPLIQSKKIRMKAVKEHFSPEQISRMGGERGMVMFNELSREVVEGVLLNKLQKLEGVYRTRGINISFQLTESGMGKLIKEGYSRQYGVRPLEGVLEQQVAERLVGLPKSTSRIPVVIDAANGALELLTLPVHEEKKAISSLPQRPPIPTGLVKKTEKPKELQPEKGPTIYLLEKEDMDLCNEYRAIQGVIADVALKNAKNYSTERMIQMKKDAERGNITTDMQSAFSIAYYEKKSSVSIREVKEKIKKVASAMYGRLLKKEVDHETQEHLQAMFLDVVEDDGDPCDLYEEFIKAVGTQKE